MSKNNIVYRGANLLELIDSEGYELIGPRKTKGISNLMRPVLDNADDALKDIEKLLYTLPSLINVIKSNVPKTELHAVLTKDQQKALAEGAEEWLESGWWCCYSGWRICGIYNIKNSCKS